MQGYLPKLSAYKLETLLTPESKLKNQESCPEPIHASHALVAPFLGSAARRGVFGSSSGSILQRVGIWFSTVRLRVKSEGRGRRLKATVKSSWAHCSSVGLTLSRPITLQHALTRDVAAGAQLGVKWRGSRVPTDSMSSTENRSSVPVFEAFRGHLAEWFQNDTV